MDTPALRSRHRTDQDKADAIGVHRNTVQKYKADYRDCDEWGQMQPAERLKRLKAKRRKEQEEARNQEREYQEREYQEQADAAPKPKRKRVSKPKVELTPEQKKAAKQVRESLNDVKPSRGPQTQDEVNCEDFFEGASLMRRASALHDGHEAVSRWRCNSRLQELIYINEYTAEMIAEIKAKVAA
jgi:hypothetical protein